MSGGGILVVRMSAMGDVIHALPAVATLKNAFPQRRLSWVVESRWAELLEGNPDVDRVIRIARRNRRSWPETLRQLRAEPFELAVDFQGLLKSAIVARLARPRRLFGFHYRLLRERLAALAYSDRVRAVASHIVDQNLELAAATGATRLVREFPLPPGVPEGTLPEGGFVLACPQAGWPAKQWPLENYAELGGRLLREAGLALVLNGPPGAAEVLGTVPNAFFHASGLKGLIDASRRAVAVIGLDSGPLHLAAALGKPGVALYGPTDPARNGPYGGTFTVLRSPSAGTTHKRNAENHAMRGITVETVWQALRERLPAPGTSAQA